MDERLDGGYGGDRGGSGDRYGRGSGASRPEGARSMPHVRRRDSDVRPAPVPPQAQGYTEARGTGYDSGYNTGQVYGGSGQGGRGGRPPRGPAGGSAPTGPVDWGRRIKLGLVVFVVVLLVWSIGTYMWASSQLKQEVDLGKVIDRPSEGEGTTYLIVGSDSREGMSAADRKRLRTGSAEGKRTDSMMLLHIGSDGPVLVSLPRDSQAEIPTFVGSESGKTFKGTGRQVKLNAAYAEDGPELLVRTIEAKTGLRIDHYAEIGFGGFADIVDAVGGVDIKVTQRMKDKKSGTDFEPGMHEMNGEEALAFSRQRYGLAGGDLDRTKNQQKFLAALAKKAATPTTIINPFRLYPTLGAGLDSLVVDKDMGLFDLARMFWAMKGVTGGDGVSMNMPISGQVNGNLIWDEAKMKQMVQQMRDGEKVTVRGN
ncbi:LCP family protein [Streptomyces sp. NPDC060194]|uniref:LCP family protein n=1 Tax=Streptomyces sp. NPDC060194 TaxID=3347069 RepID=UPI0036670DA1